MRASAVRRSGFPGNPGNGFEYQDSGFEGIVDESSCTMFTFSGGVTDLLMAPASGTVTKVRVKSGANPAPLRAVILRYRYTTNPATGQVTDRQCCTAEARGAGVPAHAQRRDPERREPPDAGGQANGQPVAAGATSWASAPWERATVPLNSTGPHTSYAFNAAGRPSSRTTRSSSPVGRAGNDWSYANYQPLVQFDWQSVPGAPPEARAPARRAGQAAGAVAASVLSKSLKMKRGRVKLSVQCTLPAGQTCKGKVSLRTRPKNPKKVKTLAAAG